MDGWICRHRVVVRAQDTDSMPASYIRRNVNTLTRFSFPMLDCRLLLFFSSSFYMHVLCSMIVLIQPLGCHTLNDSQRDACLLTASPPHKSATASTIFRHVCPIVF